MPLGELAAIGSALLWAFNSVWVRPLAQRIPALRITALQYVASATCMLLTAAALDKLGLALQIPPLQAAGLVLAALLGMGLGDTTYVRSLSTVGVSVAYPVSQAAYVLCTFVLALVLLAEPLTLRVLAGAALLLAGIWTLSREAAPAEPTGGVAVATRLRSGLLAAVFAGLCWAGTTTTLKLAITGVDLLAANALRIPMVALALNTVALNRFGPAYPVVGVPALRTIVLSGVVGMWCSSLLFVYAIDQAGAAKTAVLSSTSPVFASVLAVVFLHERITPSLGLGTALAVAGMALVA